MNRSTYLLMVAPNGARRTRADHPALPVTEDEIVDAVAAAHTAGAQAAHVHVRDAAGAHVLDAARYRALIGALAARCPDLLVQVTTEAAGRYSPAQQRALVEALRPQAVSIALQELFADPAEDETNAAFLREAMREGVAIQWILYAPEQIDQLAQHVEAGRIPPPPAMLFVLGRYARDQESRPTDLIPFLATRERCSALQNVPWSVCAFGRGETACLAAALALGGDVRIGFENSLWHADGSLASDNADRVRAMTGLVRALGLTPATPAQARARLGAGDA